MPDRPLAPDTTPVSAASLNPMDMTGRTVLVTGSSSGIGRETCVLLSQLGARVILTARNRPRLDETASLMNGTGHAVEEFDITRTEEIPDWLAGIADRVGPFDGLVHCAGMGMLLPARAWSQAATDRIMTLHVSASFALAKGFRKPKVHRKPASIVYMASTAGLVGEVGLSLYSASKGAVISMTRSLALEFVRDRIRVNCVAASLVETEMVRQTGSVLTDEQREHLVRQSHPMGLGRPRDVANAIAFLLAETARWITGATLVVDGGTTAQ